MSYQPSFAPQAGYPIPQQGNFVPQQQTFAPPQQAGFVNQAQQPAIIDPGHHHDTAKGAAGGAVAACFIPGIGPVVGGIVGAGIGHHEKRKHQEEALTGTHHHHFRADTP